MPADQQGPAKAVQHYSEVRDPQRRKGKERRVKREISNVPETQHQFQLQGQNRQKAGLLQEIGEKDLNCEERA